MSLSLPMNDRNDRHFYSDSLDRFWRYLAELLGSSVGHNWLSYLFPEPITSTTAKPKTIPRVLVSPNGRQYSSDSFDRFGDDLCELLLSYLDFEDKFRFECVSKQWKRLVFIKVFDFENNNFKTNNQNWKSIFVSILNWRQSYGKQSIDNQMKIILQKCRYVKTIKLNIDRKTVSLLSLLSDNCHRLKSIRLKIDKDVSMEAMAAFGQTIGSKVEALDISEVPINAQLLNWCPNLKHLKCQSVVWSHLVGNQLLPTLHSLNEVKVNSDQMSAFAQLVDKYEKTLKNIVVNFEGVDQIDLIFLQLYRLNNLESLHFCFHSNLIQLNITPRLITLVESCPKLSMVSFYVTSITSSPASKTLTAIKSLTIYCFEMSDDFFANLSELMPNLKKLMLALKGVEVNRYIRDISRMKHILSLIIIISDEISDPIDESVIIKLLDNCKQIRELCLFFRSNITVKTIDKLKELANNRPKETIRFSTIVSGNQSQEFQKSLAEIPNNLSINI